MQLVLEALKVLLVFLNVVIVIVCLIIALVIGLLRAPVFEWQTRQQPNNPYLIGVAVGLLVLYACNHLIAIYGITRSRVKHIIVTTIITTVCLIILIFKLSTNLFIIMILNTTLSVIYSVFVMNDSHVEVVTTGQHQLNLLNNEVPERVLQLRNSVQFADHIQHDYAAI